MEFRILGSVDVIEDGRRLRVASGHQLALLAFFLIHANRVVSAERIIDELWGDEAPESGAKSVAFHVSKLRDALEPGRPRGKPNGVLATEPAGYVLRVAPDDIDAVRFERLVLEGRGLLADDPETARARLEDALSLWRGEPYADLADEPVVQPEIRRLQEVHLHAVEDRLEADLALDGVAAQERNLVQGALRAGTFRVAASDLMPTRVAAAVDQGMLSYLTLGRLSLSQVLTEIDGSWQQKK